MVEAAKNLINSLKNYSGLVNIAYYKAQIMLLHKVTKSKGIALVFMKGILPVIEVEGVQIVFLHKAT